MSARTAIRVAGVLWLVSLALVAAGLWTPSFFPLVPLLFLLFPHGQVPSRRWPPSAWLVGIGRAMIVVGNTLAQAGIQQ